MEEKIAFENSKGDRLVGIISKPKTDTDTPIIILAHGFTSTKNTNGFLRLADILVKKNISTLRFDFYGHGESDGKFEDITTSEAVDDILCAKNYLKKCGYKKIGLLGSSFGGLASTMAASCSGDLYLLALKSPVSSFLDNDIETKSQTELDDWKRLGYCFYEAGDGRRLRLNYSFYEDFVSNDGYKAAPKIKIPTLIVHGMADNIVPVAQSKKIAKLMPNCRLVVIDGANHRYENPDQFEKMLATFSEFILAHSQSV